MKIDSGTEGMSKEIAIQIAKEHGLDFKDGDFVDTKGKYGPAGDRYEIYPGTFSELLKSRLKNDNEKE